MIQNKDLTMLMISHSRSLKNNNKNYETQIKKKFEINKQYPKKK